MALISGVEIWKTHQTEAKPKGFAVEVAGDAGCYVKWFESLEEALKEILNYPEGWQEYGKGDRPW